jgi:hypothetical protein
MQEPGRVCSRLSVGHGAGILEHDALSGNAAPAELAAIDVAAGVCIMQVRAINVQATQSAIALTKRRQSSVIGQHFRRSGCAWVLQQTRKC